MEEFLKTDEQIGCPYFYTMDVRRRYLVETRVAARTKADAVDLAMEEGILQAEEADISRFVKIRYKQAWNQHQRILCDFDEDSWVGGFEAEISSSQVYPLRSSDFSFEGDDKPGMKHYRVTFLVEDWHLFHGKAYSDESAVGMAAQIQFNELNICDSWVFLKKIERLWEDDDGANDDAYYFHEYDTDDFAYEYDPSKEGYYDEKWRIHKEQTWGVTPIFHQEEDPQDMFVRWKKMRKRKA